jgi:hypothetical protein
LLRTLEGPYGDFITRIPTHMLTGAISGGTIGTLTDNAGQGATMGALAGIPGAAAVAGAPALRKLLVDRLSHPVGPLSKQGMTGIKITHRKGPFREIHRRMANVFKLRVPQLNVERVLKRLFRNPFGTKQLKEMGRLKL